MYTNKEKPKPNPLTPSQRARKRAADRKFRKTSREKTKSYIVHLEKLVEASSAPSSDSEKVQCLIQQADENYNATLQLRSALTNIIEMAQSSLQGSNDHLARPASSAITDLASAVGASDREGIQSPPECSSTEAMETVGPGFALDQCNEESYYQDAEQLLKAVQPLQRNNDDDMPFISMPPNLDHQVVNMSVLPEEVYSCYESASLKTSEPPISALLTPCSTNSSTSIWNSLQTITHDALGSTIQTGPLVLGQAQRAHDENVLITALVHGWNLVPEKYFLDPIWQAIRRLDEQILSPYGSVEKLAVMYIVVLKLSQYLRREQVYDVPAFMRPRPVQTAIDHPPSTSFYVWPGFREHLLVWPQKYSGNKCLAYMRSCFRFSWSLDQQSLYTWNTRTGMYSLSTEFSKRVKDLQCWTVQRRFFDAYPELLGEIPTDDSELIIPYYLSPDTSQQDPHGHHHEDELPFAVADSFLDPITFSTAIN
ncbi:hypothetical protein V490_07150 [Pseudogymnoascus sp. VKM F-3557]|nr:hypothetical protein V490_07150 [Pseudogymnoascus sp. VKM F-3557]